MAEYYPLILKAVTALEPSTAQTRRALYDRARTALLTQLRSVEPALSEPDITRERLALEEAIRRVEVDAAMRQPESGEPTGLGADPQSAFEPEEPASPPARAASRSEPLPRSGPSRWAADPPAPQGSAPDLRADRPRRQVEAPFGSAGRDAISQRDTSETGRPMGAPAPSYPAIRTGPPASYADGSPGGSYSDGRPIAPDDTGRSGEPSPERRIPDWMTSRKSIAEAGLDDGARADFGRASARRQVAPQPFAQGDDEAWSPGQEPAAFDRWNPAQAPRPAFDDDADIGDYPPADENVADADHRIDATSPPSAARKSSGARKRIMAVGIMALALVAAGAASLWKGTGIWTGGMGATSRGNAEVGQATDSTVRSDAGPRGKIAERLPTSPQGATQPGTSAPRAVLYEIDQSNPDRFVGTVAWRTESAPSVPGQKPAMTVFADIEIPEQHMTIRWSLARNDDPSLPASHTIQIDITLPPGFAHGSVSDVPGIMMQPGENTQGFLLKGVVVKVQNNFFLNGLSARELDMQQNIQFLKERSWIGIPLRYSDGRQAIVVVGKGSSGERAFAAAFAAWGQ